jgi:hypothetical protein
MSHSKNPKEQKNWYLNEPAPSAGLAGEFKGVKRPVAGNRDRWESGNFLLDPACGEDRELQIEKAIAEAKQMRDNVPAKFKKTLYDPDNFKHLVKQAGQAQQEIDFQKISSAEIGALKVTSEKQAAPEVRMRQTAETILRSVSTTISGIFSRESKKSQCELYGHKQPPPGWQGAYPKCPDCGSEIRAQSDLRKASANQKDQDLKPYDNRLEL